MKKNKWIGYFLLSAVLLTAEILIGCFAGGWIRSYLGDVLVILLMYTIIRSIRPQIRHTGLLPVLLLMFSFLVEGLQAWGVVDRLHITAPLLRTLIGTSFSWIDMLCYVIGFLPLLLWELLRTFKKKVHAPIDCRQ